MIMAKGSNDRGRPDLFVVINFNGEDDSGSQSATVADIVSEIKRRISDAEPGPASFSIADLHMDRNLHEVRRSGTLVHLSPLEFSLLEHLLLYRDRVQTNRVLMNAVFGRSEREKCFNTLWVYMHSLRRKIDQRGNIPLLHTIRGVGYVLRTPAI